MRHAARRLQQSQYDRKQFKIVYRLQGDSKDRIVRLQRCKIDEFRRSQRTRILTWKEYEL